MTSSCQPIHQWAPVLWPPCVLQFDPWLSHASAPCDKRHAKHSHSRSPIRPWDLSKAKSSWVALCAKHGEERCSRFVFVFAQTNSVGNETNCFFSKTSILKLPESLLLKSGNPFHCEVTSIYCKHLPGTHVSAMAGPYWTRLTKQPKEHWPLQSTESEKMS